MLPMYGIKCIKNLKKLKFSILLKSIWNLKSTIHTMYQNLIKNRRCMIFERECISADGNLKQTLNFLSYFDISFFTGNKHNLNNTFIHR